MSSLPYDHDFSPADWTADELSCAMESTDVLSSLPAYEDDREWTNIREDPACSGVVDDLVDDAEEILETDIPGYPASLYLDYSRVPGMSQRAVMQPTLDRARRLSVVALAECFERDGRFLDAILDHAWVLCEQRTWLHPANLSDDENSNGLPVTVSPDRRNVALRPAGIAKTLAEIDYVFGDLLHPALRENIRKAVHHHVIDPYLARDDFWWMQSPANNWNAVCNAGSAMAASYFLDDRELVAEVLVNAAHNIERYIQEFDYDGCTPEGIGYWNYGFRNYTQLGEHIETRTGGAYSLIEPSIIRDIAQFPIRIRLSEGKYPAFSDAAENAYVDPFTTCWLGHRLDLPGLAAMGKRAITEASGGRFSDTIRDLVWAARTPLEWSVPRPANSHHLRGTDWWIARAEPDNPDGVVVAAKGGHNGESHNHNDVGTFVFHARGESYITDLGAPVYDNEFFGEKRYEFLAARSLGHNVPFVSDCEQAAGEELAAEFIDYTDNGSNSSFSLDLSGCYPSEANISTLRRRYDLHREENLLTIEDTARMGGNPDELDSVLMSYNPITTADIGFSIEGSSGKAVVEVENGTNLRVERLEGTIDKSESDDVEENYPDVWRARITGVPSDTADTVVSYTIQLES